MLDDKLVKVNFSEALFDEERLFKVEFPSLQPLIEVVVVVIVVVVAVVTSSL